MKRIYKYPLEVTDQQYVDLPVGAQILSVQMQSQPAWKMRAENTQPHLWALVDDAETMRCFRNVEMVGTGQPTGHIEFDLFDFISTIQMQDGRLILHVFISKE